MMLQRCLSKEPINATESLELFFHDMVTLYQQLTTNECLDLYGYFSNNDTRYLLYALLAVIQEQPLKWLPALNHKEKQAIEHVFYALQCVIEAMRVELKNRHLVTEPYSYESNKVCLEIGRRNRDAVLRALAVYGRTTLTHSSTLEQLFCDIEQTK